MIPRVAFREVLVAQLWMLWDSRRVAVLVVSLGLAMFIPVPGNGMLPFLVGIHVTVLLAALLWGAVVWHAQDPEHRMEHREMPVAFKVHDLARVLAGALLFAGAYGVIALATLFDPPVIGGPSALSAWHLFGVAAGLMAAYLFGSAAGIALRHPIAGLAIFVVGYMLLGQVLMVVLEQPARRVVTDVLGTWGLEVAVAGPVALNSTWLRGSAPTFYFPATAEWVPAVCFWFGLSILLFLLALAPPRFLRRRTSAAGRGRAGPTPPARRPSPKPPRARYRIDPVHPHAFPHRDFCHATPHILLRRPPRAPAARLRAGPGRGRLGADVRPRGSRGHGAVAGAEHGHHDAGTAVRRLPDHHAHRGHAR
ncbi:MAG: hypothetical protein WEB88_18030 [Gemmatimonadota bacterium]